MVGVPPDCPILKCNAGAKLPKYTYTLIRIIMNVVISELSSDLTSTEFKCTLKNKQGIVQSVFLGTFFFFHKKCSNVSFSILLFLDIHNFAIPRNLEKY